jgi:hypothetical protein
VDARGIEQDDVASVVHQIEHAAAPQQPGDDDRRRTLLP